MSNEVQSANAGADQKPVAKNISNSELIAMRYKAMTEAMKVPNSPEEPKEQPKEVVPDEPEVPKEEAKQEEPQPSPEEPVSALKAEIAKREESSFEAKVSNNPYANINSKEDLDAKYQELTEVMEWAEERLDRAEDLAAEDVVTNENGREYTKRELREVVKRARKARDVYIPDQGKQIQLAKNRAELKQALGEKAKTELSWLQGEDNDVRKQYEVLISDPKLKAVEKALPDLAPQLPYLLAHAANSLYARRPAETKPAARLSPPSPVVSQGAESSKPETRQSKALNDLSTRFNKSGSYKDFKAIRALQHSKF